MSEELDVRVSAKLSTNRALWDMVTPELRGVAIRVEPLRVSGRFLYEGEPDEEEREIVSEVETEVIADFPAEFEVSFRAEFLPPSHARSLLPGEEWVYLRREFREE